MRVLLIRPPIEGLHKNPSARHVPTGLMYLAHALRRKGVDARIFDSLAWRDDTHVVRRSLASATNQRKVRTNPIFKNIIHFGATWERVHKAVREAQPDVVGIASMFSPYYRQAYRTARIVDEACPKAAVFMGGAHATVMWRDVFARSPVDALVLGEGEQTFTDVVVDLASSGSGSLSRIDVSHYPGLVVRRPDGRPQANLSREFIWDLDGLGFPALEDLDFSKYGGVTSIITSRGCPFSCAFCSVHAVVGKRFRPRSVESVIDELEYYAGRDVRVVNIEDDNFTLDIDRVDRLIEAICKAGLAMELRLPNGITHINMTKGRLRAFARAGVKKLFFGLESTNEQTRAGLKKSFARFDRVSELIRVARSEGIEAHASLISGLPDHSPREMAADFVRVFLEGIDAPANPYYPVPGTELFRQLQQRRLLRETDLEWYEPMNFPLEGERFNRSDVAAACVLGLVLSRAEYKRYHHEFLRCSSRPSLREVVRALDELELLVSANSSGELVLAPRVCFCEEQDLIGGRMKDGARFHASQLCSETGKMLQTVLQLWTREGFRYQEIQCRVVDGADRCTFRFQPAPERLDEVVESFLEGVREHVSAWNAATQPSMSPDGDNRCVPCAHP